MTHVSAPDPAAGETPATTLLVKAGGVLMAVAPELLTGAGAAGTVTPLPGAPTWLAGLAQWQGRLVTVVDAGRLFGRSPSSVSWLLALRGLPCEITLGVDELLIDRTRSGDLAEVHIDAALLAAHPAFRAGAAGTQVGEVD